MKILLINPAIRSWAKPNWVPLGLAYIAGSLIRDAHEVDVLDLNACREELDLKLPGRSLSSYDLIGITGLLTSLQNIRGLVKECRQLNPTAQIVLGGPGPSYAPKIFMEHAEPDVIVVGEGEEAICEIADAITYSNSDYSKITGIWWRDIDGEMMVNPPREPMCEEDMDHIWPARHLLPMTKYIHNPLGARNKRKWLDGLPTEQHVCCTNLVASRGCPYQCIYCAKDFSGTRHRRRSVDNVVDEITYLRREYDIDYVNFADDEWMADPKWSLAFCDQMILKDPLVQWGATGRVNLVTEELLKRMELARCIQVGLGLESGSQKMLDSMRKGVTVAQAEEAVRMIQDILGPDGLNCSFMVGLPGETEETMDETLQFCKRLSIRPDAIFFATPYPGTALYRQALSKGLIANELEYVLSLGEQGDKIACNCSDLSDALLREKRDAMMKELCP